MTCPITGIPSDAEAFLPMLGDRHTFQTFDDSPRKERRLSRVLHGTLIEHASALSALNAKGAGVFVMVNEGDGEGRRGANVVRVRALFVALDGAPLDPVKRAPLAPHCVVESSLGRWHAYWRVAGCSRERFSGLQKALAARFGGDPKVFDLPRVMRVPGFCHRKREPRLVRIAAMRERPSYDLGELVKAFDLSQALDQVTVSKRVLPQTIPEGERNNTLLSLAAGFARKGHDTRAVSDRLQRINAERCRPPLCASELDTIVARAAKYGSSGFILLPHALLDSAEWKALPPAAHDVILTAYRRFDGHNNGNIALTWTDFQRLPGFADHKTFYRHRASAVKSGILVETQLGKHTQNGITPTLYAIAARFLPEWLTGKTPASAKSRNAPSYIDRQDGCESGSGAIATRRRTFEADAA